jgi:putative ABC transport system permease protein
MLTSYIKIAWRNMGRNKLYSAINLAGLAIGIASFLLVLYFIQYERSYDRFHPNTVYRLGMITQSENTAPQKIARTMFPMGPTLQSDFAEVADFTRVISMERVPLQRPGMPAIMATACGADASFFSVFNFKLIRGDPQSVLEKPNSIVVTHALATRLFGSEDPVGQIIQHQGRDTTLYMVTGVLQGLPAQTHLRFEAIHSMNPALVAEENGNWENAWMSTYLRLTDGADARRLQVAFPAFLQRHMEPEKAHQYELLLQPVRDIHLWSSSFSQDQLNNQKFNGSYLYLLAFVSLLVLALAIINYANLTTAQTINRAREIAVRKTNGAARAEIVFQFLVETLLLTAIALFLALALIGLVITPINTFSGREIPFDLWREPFWLLTGGAIALGAGLLSGFPVARSLSGIQPVRVLKGHFWKSARSPLGNAMVVLQFTIAIALSIAAVSAFRQLKFMQEYDIGFDKEEVIVAQVSWVKRNRVVTLMDELRKIPGVKDVTGALRRLGDPIDQNEVVFQNANQQTFRMPATTMFVDFNYVPFYGIELLAGRNISPKYGGDVNGNSYLINESMAERLLGYTDDPNATISSLIGQGFRYNFQDSLGTIVGIIRDFNFNSLHHNVEPLCLTYQYDYYFRELSVRIDKGRLAGTLPMVEAKWKEMLPNQEMEYRFLDEQMDQLYRTDRQVGQMMAVLTFLALFISCFGLIGLAVFNTGRRVKEIGIRKVLGATVGRIVIMLSNDFIRLVGMAFVIATPVAWWAVNNWLEDFAYRIDIEWWMFATAGLGAVVIALITVIGQSIQAAAANPVKSLRSE